MARYIFPAGSVTSTGTRQRLVPYLSTTDETPETEIAYVRGTTETGKGRQSIVTDESGAYTAFVGPEGASTLHLERPNGTRVSVASSTATTDTTPAGASASALAADPAFTGTYASRLTKADQFRAAALAASRSDVLALHPAPPTLTQGTSTQATGLGLSSSVRLSVSAANRAKVRVVGGNGRNHSGGLYYVADTLTMSDGSGGNTVGGDAAGVATRYSYLWGLEWVTDAPWHQMVQMARTAGYMLYVDGLPVSATDPIATTVNTGGGCYTLIDWSIGSATIVAATGVLTLSAAPAERLRVGDIVWLKAITTTTGVTANTPYYVLTAPTATTFTLSATPGGAALTLTGDGSTDGVALQKTRRYRLEYNNGSFLELHMDPRHSLYAPQDETLRVATVGDSLDAMAGSTRAAGGWQNIAGRLLGWHDVRICSFGGTGFTTAAAHCTAFADPLRVADVVAQNPDLLIVTISQNDEPNRSTTFPAAMLAGLQAYRTALPSIPIVVVGADASSSGPATSRIELETIAKGVFDSWADARSWWIPNCTDPSGPWFTGTGTAASRTGTGNRDMYGSDAAHCNDQGHLHNARRFAAAFRARVLPTLY